MAWVLVLVAGLLEVGWAFAMKQSDGFQRLGPTVATLLGMVASFGLLAIAMKTLPLGTAYTVWTGIGAVGSFVVGVALLGEPMTAPRLIAVSLLVVGLVMMKLSTH